MRCVEIVAVSNRITIARVEPQGHRPDITSDPEYASNFSIYLGEEAGLKNYLVDGIELFAVDDDGHRHLFAPAPRVLKVIESRDLGFERLG
jgi:hypothetical protein